MEVLSIKTENNLNEKDVISEQDRHKLENKRKRKFIRRFLNKNIIDYDALDDDQYDFLYN